MSLDDLLSNVDQATVVRPGDVLVFTLPGSSHEELDRFAEHLRAQLPDTVKTLVIGGAVELHVLRPGEREAETTEPPALLKQLHEMWWGVPPADRERCQWWWVMSQETLDRVKDSAAEVSTAVLLWDGAVTIFGQPVKIDPSERDIRLARRDEVTS